MTYFVYSKVSTDCGVERKRLRPTSNYSLFAAPFLLLQLAVQFLKTSNVSNRLRLRKAARAKSCRKRSVWEKKNEKKKTF